MAQNATLLTWLKQAQEERDRAIPHVEFTPAWLTIDRKRTFKSGADMLGISLQQEIETISEPQTDSFSRQVVDMFIISGFRVHDFGQGDFVGTPSTHRLAAGITIVAQFRASELSSCESGSSAWVF
jgi:hypothetical protein